MWTQEMDDRMLEMVKNNASASQVGREVGKTRNAVLGRAYRLGIHFGQKGFWETNLLNRLRDLYVAKTPRAVIASEFGVSEKAINDQLTRLHRGGLDYRPRPSGSNGGRAYARNLSLRGGIGRVRRPKPPAGVHFGAVTFRDLEPWHCRYIAGDVAGLDTRCCGAEALPDLPYCLSHWKLTHAPAPVHAD